MSSTTDTAAQIDCMSPLDEEGRRAVRRYWEQVIREEWVPAERGVPRAVPLAEDGRRERREARRAIARIAAAGRVAPVVAMRSPSVSVSTVGEAA
ncbi:MAG: hypothetical protein ACT4RN_06785 [Pseudonocardia sp.]